MKFFTVFRKTLLEMSRDKWMLGLTLAFAPFFVLLYGLITAGGSTTYTILTINNDKGIQLADGTTFNAGRDAVASLARVTYADGQPILKSVHAAGLTEAEPILRNRILPALHLTCAEIAGRFCCAQQQVFRLRERTRKRVHSLRSRDSGSRVQTARHTSRERFEG